MEHGTGPENEPQDDTRVSVVVVPGDLRQQVLDYIDGLASDDPDVSSYMLNAAGTRIGAQLMAKASNTNCTFWDTKGPAGGVDFTCLD